MRLFLRSMLCAIVLNVFLWGCVGREFPTAPISNIQPNVTTREQIFATFGEPTERGLDTGLETWTYYRYTLGQQRGKQLRVIFNRDGTVKSYAYSAN
jgi:hypothetical protein